MMPFVRNIHNRNLAKIDDIKSWHKESFISKGPMSLHTFIKNIDIDNFLANIDTATSKGDNFITAFKDIISNGYGLEPIFAEGFSWNGACFRFKATANTRTNESVGRTCGIELLIEQSIDNPILSDWGNLHLDATIYVEDENTAVEHTVLISRNSSLFHAVFGGKENAENLLKIGIKHKHSHHYDEAKHSLIDFDAQLGRITDNHFHYASVEGDFAIQAVKYGWKSPQFNEYKPHIVQAIHASSLWTSGGLDLSQIDLVEMKNVNQENHLANLIGLMEMLGEKNPAQKVCEHYHKTNNSDFDKLIASQLTTKQMLSVNWLKVKRNDGVNTPHVNAGALRQKAKHILDNKPAELSLSAHAL